VQLDVMLLIALAALAVWTEADKWRAARLRSLDDRAQSGLSNQSTAR
jgi:hypothetical protein